MGKPTEEYMKKMILMCVAMLVMVANAGEVDLKKSVIDWKGTKVTGEHTGKISLKSGKVEFKGDKLASGEFVVDMNSITNSDIESEEWRNKFLGHMKSGDFFDVEKYPTSKLVIKSVDGDMVKGDLTIKDKTNPVEFKFKKEKDGYSGKLEFDRTKYGMVYNSGNFFKDLGDKLIHDKVELAFTMYLKK